MYPDSRSENKGNEPENAAYGMYGKESLLFVNSERSSAVIVYDVSDPYHPELKQVLPAGPGPEGSVTIPERNLLAVASEVDDRGDKIRSIINIYYKGYDEPVYPFMYSIDRGDGTPIPFSALSALTTAKCDEPYTPAPPAKGKGKGKGGRRFLQMGKGGS